MQHSIYTIGHSTRSVAEFIELLRMAGTDLVADVRTIPRSRLNPQFNADTLTLTLRASGIAYRALPKLGGLRSRVKGAGQSPNGFWENSNFRNYADYALTPAFRDGLTELEAIAEAHTPAVMCAEAVWWRCHRRIIADYLLTAGWPVFHILGRGKMEAARLTPAVIPRQEGGLIYPPIAPRLL